MDLKTKQIKETDEQMFIVPHKTDGRTGGRTDRETDKILQYKITARTRTKIHIRNSDNIMFKCVSD